MGLVDFLICSIHLFFFFQKALLPGVCQCLSSGTLCPCSLDLGYQWVESRNSLKCPEPYSSPLGPTRNVCELRLLCLDPQVFLTRSISSFPCVSSPSSTCVSLEISQRELISRLMTTRVRTLFGGFRPFSW